MKKILLAFMVCAQLMAQSVYVNCAGSTLGQTYSTSTPSLQTVLTGLKNAPLISHLMIEAPTAVVTNICATLSPSSSAPSTHTDAEHCALPGSIITWAAVQTPNSHTFNVYLRADQADCTASGFYVDFW